MKEIKLPTHSKTALYSTTIKGREAMVMIAPLDEADETRLKNLYPVVIDKLRIRHSDVYMFGEVDIQKDKPAICALTSDNLYKGYIMPANYDYDTHTVTIESNKCILHRETFDIYNMFRYAYNAINRPKRVIVFAVDKIDFKMGRYYE